jgi:hypothetical protein
VYQIQPHVSDACLKDIHGLNTVFQAHIEYMETVQCKRTSTLLADEQVGIIYLTNRIYTVLRYANVSRMLHTYEDDSA